MISHVTTDHSLGIRRDIQRSPRHWDVYYTIANHQRYMIRHFAYETKSHTMLIQFEVTETIQKMKKINK